MIFILIGPDMAGKTTLGKGLANKFGTLIDYRKFSHYSTQEESLEAAEKVVNSLIKSTAPAPVLLFDRFHFPDDLVYGPATKRYDIKKPVLSRYLKEVIPKLIRLQTAFIYCYAPVDVLEDRFKQRGDDYIIPDYLPAIIRHYKFWIAHNTFKAFPVKQLNSGKLNAVEMLHEAAEFVRIQAGEFQGRRR